MTAEWREAFWALGLQRGARFTSAHVMVEIVMRAPLADTGNAYGTVKAAIDGLVDAGVLPGDGPQHVLSLTMLAPVKATKDMAESVTLTLVAGDSDPYRCPFCANWQH